MAKRTTPEKPPSRAEASIAGRALRTGKASPAQIRSMAGRIESERAAVKRAKSAEAVSDRKTRMSSQRPSIWCCALYPNLLA